MKYYSPEEIAEHFSLKPGTVRLWIRQGKLKAVKLGSLWRVSEEALQEFVQQDRQESAARMLEQIRADYKGDGWRARRFARNG